MGTDPTAPPAHVTHGDVMPYAKRACRNCNGKGELTTLTPSNTETGFTRRAKLCGCALRRFMRERGGEVELINAGKEQGALVWKPKPVEPETIPGSFKPGPGGVEIGERADGSKHVTVHINSDTDEVST